MPSATRELQDQMNRWFGSPVDDRGPGEFLLSHGFEEKDGLWRKPTPAHNLSLDEAACLSFLMQEWDYDMEDEP